MALNELSRAVAMKALAAEVSARLESGEKPNAIRAQLLADGIAAEVLDQVFLECEATRPTTGRKRTIFAIVLSAILMIGLPIAGALGGAWGAYALAVPANAPEPNPESVEREARSENGGPAIETLAAILVGILIGGGLGLAIAFPVVRSISEWSIDSALNDDAVDE